MVGVVQVEGEYVFGGWWQLFYLVFGEQGVVGQVDGVGVFYGDLVNLVLVVDVCVFYGWFFIL